jgi:hypothetical protein
MLSHDLWEMKMKIEVVMLGNEKVFSYIDSNGEMLTRDRIVTPSIVILADFEIMRNDKVFLTGYIRMLGTHGEAQFFVFKSGKYNDHTEVVFAKDYYVGDVWIINQKELRNQKKIEGLDDLLWIYLDRDFHGPYKDLFTYE